MTKTPTLATRIVNALMTDDGVGLIQWGWEDVMGDDDGPGIRRAWRAIVNAEIAAHRAEQFTRTSPNITADAAGTVTIEIAPKTARAAHQTITDHGADD